jgi:cyanoexosortase A
MLWYIGFDVRREGLSLLLPTGRVDVYGACSGIQSMLQMLYISVLFVLLFALRSRVQQFLTVGLAVLIGFLVNAARVGLMAVLVAFSQKDAFDYWHTGNGSLIFAAIAVALFGSFCWFAFLRTTPSVTDTGNSSNG